MNSRDYITDGRVEDALEIPRIIDLVRADGALQSGNKLSFLAIHDTNRGKDAAKHESNGSFRFAFVCFGLGLCLEFTRVQDEFTYFINTNLRVHEKNWP